MATQARQHMIANGLLRCGILHGLKEGYCSCALV